MVSVETILSDQDDLGNFEQLCRLCGRLQQPSTNIFDEKNHYNYSKVLNLHFKEEFQVSNTDILPLKVCGNCLASVMSWHEFYHGCVQINKKFHDLIEKFNLKEEKKPDKVTAPANDIEVIEVSVDGANFDLLNEQETTSEFDISNVNIKETHSVDTVSDNDFDNFNDFGSNDESESSSDSHEKEAEGAEEAENIVSDKSTTDSQKENKNTIVAQKSKKKKSTVCRICGKLYTSRSSYLHHLQKSHSAHPVGKAPKKKPVAQNPENLVPVVCHLCGKTFRHRSSYRNHIKYVHAANPDTVVKPKKARRMCELCGKMLTGSTFKSHMNKHFDPEAVKCKDCGKEFAYNSTLKSHIRVCHTTERPFQCELCPSNFKRADYLRSHIRYKHQDNMEGIFKCNICDNVYKTEKYYLQHMKSHGEGEVTRIKENFFCKICNLTFKKRNYLLLHERYVHVRGQPYSISENAEGQYKCDKCDRRFSSVSGRNYHCKNAHGTVFDMNFSAECDHCGMTFKNRVFYARHQAKLKGSPTCYLCWQNFATKEELDKHMDVDHFTDLPFVCEICHVRFVALKNLNHHLRTRHFNDKPFKCDLCPHRSTRKDALEIHIRGCHLGEKPYQCSMCEKRFSQRTDLRKHEVRHTRNKC